MRIHSTPINDDGDDMGKIYNPSNQAERFARCEQALKEAGGRRINVRLQPKAAKALDRLMKRWGVDQTAAVNQALEQAR